MAGAGSTSPSQFRLMLFLGLGLAAVGVLLAVLLVQNRDVTEGITTFPPPARYEPTEVSRDDFTGAETCGECHSDQYERWTTSTHGRAGGEPDAQSLIAPFDGRPIQFADADVIPAFNDGAYTFTIRQAGQDDVVYRVDGVIGRGHMVGGGTQGFVSQLPDGTIRFLPFDFIRQENVWFCNTITRANRGWIPITPQMNLADCADWPPVRILGTDARFSNCQECHGSQILVAYDTTQHVYRTNVNSYRVNCESCHGPGAQHVQLAAAGELASRVDLAIRTFTAVPPDSSLTVCFQCHSVKTVLSEGYLPGMSFEAHYSTKLELVGNSPLFPDGRVRTFAYQQNHLYSDCYLSGSMTCVDCHDPHSNDYRDQEGRVLDGRFSDGQCLGCHPSKSQDIPAHTNHPAESEGSRCVSCHMPYLQHPELGDEVRYARSDHTIPIPRPAFDDSLGVRNACAFCHEQTSTLELQAQVNEWYGEIKPHKDIVSGLLSLNPQYDRLDALRALLPPGNGHAIANVAGLGRFIEGYLRPDMPQLEEEVVERLRELAGHNDFDVQAVAMAGLHLAQGTRREVRDFLAAALSSLAPATDRIVRRRWSVTLGYLGDLYRTRGELQIAVLAYGKALEVLPGDPVMLGQLADAYAYLGDFDRAVETFSEALNADPNRPLTWVNFGVALEGQSLMEDAAGAYRRALEVNPRESLALFNMGNYHLRRNEMTQAIEFYQRAVESDPSLAQGHYLLARALAQQNRLAEARKSALHAVEFDPENEAAATLLQQIEAALQ